MSAVKSLTLLFLLALPSLTLGHPSSPNFARQTPSCPACNPASGLNTCDITTSCITTGENHYCACRAGYKAFNAFPGTDDGSVQFRILGGDFENRVYVATGTACDVLCDDLWAAPGPDGLCSEVGLREECVL